MADLDLCDCVDSDVCVRSIVRRGRRECRHRPGFLTGLHPAPLDASSDGSDANQGDGAIGEKYPVLVGETGDSSAGPVTFLPTFLAYADPQGWNYLAWTWNPWQDSSNLLVTDWAATPTAGQGAAWRSHVLAFPFQN